MHLFERSTRQVLGCVLVALASACEPVPDLAPVEMAFSAGTAGAGATEPSKRLTTSEFGRRIRQAVESSPTLAQANTEVDLARANLDVAEGAFLPQLSLGLNARSERVDSDASDVSPYLRVSQLVYDGGAASGNLAAARARMLESRGSQLQTASATVLAAIEAYVSVLNRRELVAIAWQNVATHEQIERQISERTEIGAGSTADLLTARSRIADARTKLADAQAQVDRSIARFREIFGYDPGALPAPLPAPVLNRSDSQIVMNSPQVRRADAALLAAKAEQSAALARRKPDIRVSAFANQDDSHDANFGVDLSVNYEIDSTGKRRAEIAAASARIKQAEYERETLIREIGREIGFIRSDQKAGAERLKEARGAVQANIRTVSAMQEQFKIGRSSLIEILDAQRDLVAAQERMILAEQNFFLTNYAAISLTGDILDLFDIQLENWNGMP